MSIITQKFLKSLYGSNSLLISSNNKALRTLIAISSDQPFALMVSRKLLIKYEKRCFKDVRWVISRVKFSSVPDTKQKTDVFLNIV